MVATVSAPREEVATEAVAGPAEPEVAKKGKQDAADAPAAAGAGDKKK